MAADVAIVGAGIVGCSTAYYLARQGVKVTVYDREGLAAGASGRNNGIIEHPYDETSTPLFEESVGFLREVLGDKMPAQPVGALLLAPDEAAARELVAHYSQFRGLDPALLTPEQTRAEEPLLAEGLWGCLLNTGYPISPVETTKGVAAFALVAGADFVLGEPVDLAELRRTSREVVIAAGANSATVLAGQVPPDTVKPLWGVIVQIELPQRPRHPIIEGTVTRGLTTGKIEHVSPFTLLDSPSWLAVGSTLLEGPEPRAEEWTPRLLEQGARFVPAIAAAQVRGTLVCARPKAFDNRPILGRIPGQQHLWIGSGHGGRGMSLGPASGRLLAEAILSGSEEAIPAALAAARISR